VLRATDRLGHWGEADVLITAQDTVPPTVSVSVAPATIAPADGRWVDETATVTAFDFCTGTSWTLQSIDDNDVAPDDGIQGAELGTPDSSFSLRAQHADSKSNRIYTVVYSAADGAGNVAHAAAHVLVPQTPSVDDDLVNITVRQSPEGTVVAWGSPAALSPHDVIRGALRSVRGAGGVVDVGSVVCIEENSSDPDTSRNEDVAVPAPGEVWFYLVDRNDGITRSWGIDGQGRPRTPGWGSCSLDKTFH
jgi:hypothetical protein